MNNICYSDKGITHLLFGLLTLNICEILFVLLRIKVKQSPQLGQKLYDVSMKQLECERSR